MPGSMLAPSRTYIAPSETAQAPDQVEPWLVAGQIPLLDGFRALAVLLVLAAHACQTSGFPGDGKWTHVIEHGAIGVDLFFVISGFLITTLLLREKQRHGRVSLKNFFVRRCLRILPVYYCFLLAVFLLQCFGAAHLSSADWLGALTYTTNFIWNPGWELGHAWSLSIEEHFYLVWPLAFVLLGVPRCGKAALACIGLGFCLRAGLLVWCREDAWMAGRWTFTRCDAIALGCLLAIAAQTPHHRNWLNRICRIRCMPALAVLGLVASIVLGELTFRYKIAFGYTVNGLMISALLWSSLLRSKQASFQWLNAGWLRAIGIRSYSLYLWQQLFLNPQGNGFVQSFPCNLLGVILAAWTSYRFIEMPIQNLRVRFSTAQEKRRALMDELAKATADSEQTRQDTRTCPADATALAVH